MQIEYFTIESLPDRPMFRCDKHRCTLQVESCASMWKQAQERGAPERLDLCRNCPIGAKHAGVGEISLSPLRGASICGRCDTGATRLIRRHLCPSCYNRELEYDKGYNAKGSAPIKHPDLHVVTVLVRTGGAVLKYSKGRVSSPEELVIAALRDEPRQVTFSFLGRGPELEQGELF